MYDFTETGVTSGGIGVHVTFNLPTFLQDTGDVTTFNVITDPFGSPVTDVELVGGGGGTCDISGSPVTPSAPCWMVKLANGIIASSNADNPGAAFDGPGTFTSRSETLTITEVSGVPEPGSVVLLLTVIAAVALLVGKRRPSKNSPALEP
jgi:hypothetical protein